jgi:L-arabinose isomerase
MFDLYDAWPELKPAMAQFAGRIAATMAPFAEVEFPGVCSTREQVSRAIAGFEASGKDAVVVVLLTYAPSTIALPALLATRLPVLLFNTQELYEVHRETRGSDTTHNHGMHGVQDLANVLLRAGRPFHIVTGHYLDPLALAEVKGWCDAARTVKQLAGLRIGLLGYAMEGMGDFGLDETALLAQVGAEVRHLSMKSLASEAKSAPQTAIAEQMAGDRQRFQFDLGITPQEHEASARLEWALRESLTRGGMHGFASHFLAVANEGWLDTLPFLAAAKLMADGYGFGGEGDVTSAVAVCMMQALAGSANFTEMFTMDFAGNTALMMHMGEGNWRMARRDEPVRVVRSTLGALMEVRVDPLLLAFTLEPGPCTLVSLTTVADGKLKLVIAEGDVVDHPYIPDLNRPHYKFRPGGDLCDFLTRFSLEGGSHHQAMAYGRWAGALEKTAALLRIECARV